MTGAWDIACVMFQVDPSQKRCKPDPAIPELLHNNPTQQAAAPVLTVKLLS